MLNNGIKYTEEHDIEPEEGLNDKEQHEEKQQQKQNKQNVQNVQKLIHDKTNNQPTPAKQQEQLKSLPSLQSIEIQSPLKKPLTKKSPKQQQRPVFSQPKLPLHKLQLSAKPPTSTHPMKSTIKSSTKLKPVNKPFYQQTYYITGIKENYLLLLSDNNQVLEFPIGMFTTQGGAMEGQDNNQIEQNQQAHLIKDIKIGQPIKIKLEFDFMRQEKDEKIFHSLQKSINEEYSTDGNEEKLQIRKR